MSNTTPISTELLQLVINYLATKPYGETFQLIGALQVQHQLAAQEAANPASAPAANKRKKETAPSD